MKVNAPIVHNDPTSAPKTHPNSRTTTGGAFNEVLKKAVSPSVNEGGELNQAKPCVFRTSGMGEASSPLVKQLTSMLDLMDDFASGLGDLDCTLKELEPIALELNNLLQDIGESGPGDPLNELAAEIRAQAQSEIIKFKRGDYV